MSKLASSRWSKNCTSPIVNVAVVGGTHGNELHGVYLVRELSSEPTASQLRSDFTSLRVQALIGNPAAVAATGTGAGRRYVDVDLNRCFLTKDLADTSIDTVEATRARAVDALLGPKSSADPRCNFIFDLHSTTSNTGILLCVHPNDTFSQELIAYLHTKHPDISSCLWSLGEVPLLPSVARSGITVEVGPIAHSTANAVLYEKTKSLLQDAMGYIHRHNCSLPQLSETMNDSSRLNMIDVTFPMYERAATIGYPRDAEGNIIGLVHPTLQGSAELNGGTIIKLDSPIFQMICDGSAVLFEGLDKKPSVSFKIDFVGPEAVQSAATGKRTREDDADPNGDDNPDDLLYPMFINEAAYNEKDIAFVLMRRREIKLSVLNNV